MGSVSPALFVLDPDVHALLQTHNRTKISAYQAVPLKTDTQLETALKDALMREDKEINGIPPSMFFPDPLTIYLIIEIQ